MSEYDKFHSESHEEDSKMKSLLREIDLQICLMRILRSQIESCIRTGKHADIEVREVGSRYGKSGYMADVELDDHGEISAIRYDWVDP